MKTKRELEKGHTHTFTHIPRDRDRMSSQNQE